MTNFEKPIAVSDYSLSTSTLFEEFFIWLITKLFFPALPVILPFFVEFFIPSFDYPFPNQTILIMTFIFPIITMTETKSKFVQMIGLFITSMAALPLFLLSLLGEAGIIFIDLTTLYRLGLW